MGKFRDYNPALKFGNKIYPEDLATGDPWANYFYVDGDNGSDSANNGSAVDKPTATIQQAVDNGAEGDVIFVRTKTQGIWDPVAYDESVTIPYTKPNMSIIGISPGGASLAYGSMPLLGITSGSATYCLTIRAPGCRISGMSISATGVTTGGGILLDDDGSTKAAYGTTIDGNYFYECLDDKLVPAGGGVTIGANGGAWQLRVLNNYFMACSAGIDLLGTGQSRPTDVLIQGNIFASWVNTQVDCDIYLAGGSGAQGVVIDSNKFASVDGVNKTEDHYMNLTGCEGLVSNNTFACKSGSEDTPLTFGASTHTGIKIPATIRMANNWGEAAVGSKANGLGPLLREN